MKKIFTCIFLVLSTTILFGQYTPEIDVESADDVNDGAEMQLSTPSESNFLRFFSGRQGDPKPFIYFSNEDTFRIANGLADFSEFRERITILPNGYVGVNARKPQSQFHAAGDITTSWDVTFKHYREGWKHPNLPYLRKDASKSLGDYLYMGASGNRDNSMQTAFMLSQYEGFKLGKGHNAGDQLSVEFVSVDTMGCIRINSLAMAGAADRVVAADSMGKLKIAEPVSKGIYFSPFIGQVARASSPMTMGEDPTGFVGKRRITTSMDVGPTDLEWVVFPLTLPQGNIDSIQICYAVNNQNTDGQDAYIDHTRLNNMPGSQFGYVVSEDAQDRSDADACYTTIPSVSGEISGTMIMMLRIAIGTSDSIDIGRITVYVSE